MTPLTKPVTRRSEATVRDRGRNRRLVVTLYPSGILGLRQERSRREETLTLEAAWSMAVKMRVAAEKREKKARKVR
jgi:hypothetical protein